MRFSGAAIGVMAAACLSVLGTTSATPKPKLSPLAADEVEKELGINGDVLISTWPAGFPETVVWMSDLVTGGTSEGVALHLSAREQGDGRPFGGAEFQVVDPAAVWGRVEWQAQLPFAPSGSVVAMFLYKKPHDVATDREFDFEYVPGDPKSNHPLGTMQMTIHMKPHDGSGSRQSSSWIIPMPQHCIKNMCGWAIEIQPKHISFFLDRNGGKGWENIGLYNHGSGWDLSAGGEMGGELRGPRTFSAARVWSEQAVNAFASYWATDDIVGWLGPLDQEALKAGAPAFLLYSMNVHPFAELSTPGNDDWSLEGGGNIVIGTLPSSPLDPTEVEYRVDGGPWQILGPASLGSYPSEARRAGQEVQIRFVARGPSFAQSSYEVVSEPSAVKVK